MENKDQMKIPEDLAGYQALIIGEVIMDGDIIVFHRSRNKCFAKVSIGSRHLLDDEFDVYRKMACPKAGDHDKDWIGSPAPDGQNFYTPNPHKAKTDDSGKPPLANLPWKAVREVAMVQAYGHSKYGDFNNFRKGMEVDRNLSCAIRHIADFMDGIDLDKESNRHHLAHAACRILFALENIIDGVSTDTRYKK